MSGACRGRLAAQSPNNPVVMHGAMRSAHKHAFPWRRPILRESHVASRACEQAGAHDLAYTARENRMVIRFAAGDARARRAWYA